MSEFTDKLMNRARELDSRPGLSSSSAPSGSSGGSGSFSERLLSRARELDRKVTPSYTWQGHEQAERDFDAWAPQIEEMDTSLANREKILNGYVERLQALQEEPYSQSNAYKYRAMYDNYEKALREYNDMVRERNALSGRMGSALEQYRSWSGGQDAQAETYRQEAAALDERNAELDREMRNYALVNTPFGLENAGPYQAMQEEYDANAARAAELRRMADEAQWQYYGGLRLNEDWAEHQNVLTVAEMADRGYITESPYYDGSLVYEYINDINNRRDMMHGYDASGTRYEAYSKMTPDEIAVYNYIYSAQGPEAAETYLSRLRNELNTRLGTENYEEMGGLGKALYWIPAGFDRFAQGLRQLGNEEAVPVTPMTVTSSLIQQEAQETSPVLGGLYDLGANITNMVPSLLASVLTGGAFGAAAGSTLLGASAGGNTYADVMRDPERQYSAQQARDYATLVGVSEGALSYLLGGISRLGGVSTRQVLTKLGGLDNALGRIARSSAAPYVMNMISEGTEEGLQELLEPAFATLILGTEYDGNFGDAAYAFLLGALTAGIVEGSEIGVSRALGGGQGFTYSDMDGFVGENGVNYFEGCDTLEEVEARYRELARENHPDLGGDTSVMADINRQHDMAKAFFQGRRQGAEQRRERRGEAEGETARGVAGALTAAQEAAQTAGDMAAAERAALRADAAALAPRTVPTAESAAPAVGETAAEALGDMAAAPGVSGALENNLGGITDERAERAAGVFGGDGGRLPDTGSGGQVQELEEGAGRTRLSSAEQGRAALERQAAARNLRAEKVSAADLGVASGTDTATSTVYPEELWDDELQRVAEEIYNRAGREVTYVIGSLEVEGADGTRSRVRGVWSEDGNIIVQVDNMRVSASQIADHELYHHAANNLPGMDYVAEERIIEQYGEEEFSRVLDVYIKKMRGIIRLPANATNEEIDNALAYVKQEVFADAYAGINAFGAGADRFYDTVREVVEERTGGGPRSETEEAARDITGPPAGERYNYAGQNAANADLEALDTAEEMERRATPPDLGDENTVFADDEIPVKARFSLDEPVERTADLVAVHNIYPDDLARTLELGAFPMPSIAVIRDSVRHDDFGNISIVFGSDTINPERDSRNRVYSRDAWTPTFPRTDTSGMSVDEIVGLMERQPERQIFGDNPGRRLMMASIESFGSLDEIRAAEGRIDGTSRNSQTDVNHLGAELVKIAESLVTPENVENTNIYAVDDAEIADFNRLYDLTEELAAAKDNKVKERRGDEEEEELSFIWADAVDDVRDTYAVEAEALVGNLTLTPKFMRTVDNLLTQDEADFLEITEEEARHIIDVVNDVGSRVTMNEAARDAAELSLDSWAQDVILAAAEGPHNLQAVKDTLEGYGFTPDDESANRVLALINEAAALSTRYFEAKPHRVVEFNEIRGVVMPDDVGGDLGERLSALNIPVIEYRAGDEADRARAVNSVEGARFSLDEEEAAWDESAPVDAEGNRLSEQQREFFANSEVRLEPDGTYYQGQGRLLPVYHSTYNDFTVFDFNRLGENTDYYASDEWFGAGSHVGFWFNTQDLSGRAGTRTEKVYLNIQNIYALNSLDELASAIYNHSDSGEMTASEAAEAFRAELEAEGYDGLLIYNDDEFGGMSFVAFHPEQIKRTTNANPTNSEDIRYSISEPEREDAPAEQAEQGPRQRRQRRTTKPVAESRPIIAAQNLRRNIYAQFSIPEGQRAEISHFLDGYTEKLIKNGELSDADRAELFDRLYAAGVMTVPADEYYSVGREAVVGRRMYVDEATKRDFGDDWNSIRRRAFGAGIYLTNNSADMAADQWNAELGETLPGLFNAEETDPRAIIERVIQVAEEGRDEQMSLAEYTNFLAGQEYVSEDEVLNQLENQLDWDLRTFAESAGIEIKLRDRTGVKIEQERERAWESRRDIRRRADERVREADERRWAAQAEARERIERMTQEERKKYYERSERERVRRLNRETRERERRKAMAERQRQNRELRELQKKTLNQLRWLARNQHRAPKELQETWNDVLGDIDLYAINAANEMNWSNKYQATWRDIAAMVSDFKSNKEKYPNFIPSEELKRIGDRVNNDKIADMDIGALQDLYKAAVGLRTEFYNRNNVINDEKGRLFAELYAESKEEINSAPGGYVRGRAKHAADNYANLEQLTPMNVLERMAGWNPDSAFYSMAKQLEKGEMDERAYIVQANRMLEDFLREHEEWVMRSDGQGKDAIWYEIEVPELLELGMGDKPVFGDTVKVYMTPAQKVHLYLESKNYDNLRHMVGGRTFPDKELYSEGKRQEAYTQGNGRTIQLAPETVRHLVENMTPEEQELAGILERYYNNFAAERINAVSNVLYGYDRAITRNYAPIYTDSNFNQKEIGKFDQTAEGVGNMKERIKGAKNPSYNISAYDAFERHVDQTARFVGMAIPVRNWQTLLNWRERKNGMRSVITHKWGKESLDYITSLLEDLQGGAPRKERFALTRGIDKLRSNYISAIFGANPSIIIKQLGSIPMGGAYLGIENVPSFSQLAHIDRELIGKYTSELDWRLMGYSSLETKQLKDHPNWTQRNSFFRTVFGGGAITRMDGWAASTLWPWAENKVKRERPELTIGTAEEISAGNSPFYKEVAREFNNAVSRSQSMSDTLHNAKIRRTDNLILRTFTMFKSDSAQTYNAIRQKIGEAQYYKRIGADAKAQRAARIAIGTAILAFLLSAAWGEAVNFLINLWKKKGENYRDDEGELTAESAIKEMVFNMVGSLGGVVLGGEELADIIGNIITGDRWYGIDATGIEQVNDSLEAIQNAGKKLMNLVGEAKNIASQGGDVSAYFAEHSSDIVGGVKELAETAAMYFAGLPVSNVEAYILGILRWVSPELVTAYEDALATADKSGLSGLTGEALATRVKDILAGRLETVDDETASAIGTLYEAGYASVVPPTAPSSVTIDHESYELDAYAQQRYNQAWANAIGGALDEVVATPEFQSATTEEKADMVRRLYEYANAKGRDAAVPEYVLPDWVAEVDAGLAAGGSLSEWAVYEVLSSDVSGTFDRLTDEGLGRGDALDIAETLDELGEDASSTEKYMAIAELPISEAEKDMALEGIMSESAYAKYAAAREAGIDTYDYCVFLDHIAGISGDGRQERIWAYIDAMPLTDAQKDALHLAAGYKESTLNKAPWRR